MDTFLCLSPGWLGLLDFRKKLIKIFMRSVLPLFQKSIFTDWFSAPYSLWTKKRWIFVNTPCKRHINTIFVESFGCNLKALGVCSKRKRRLKNNNNKTPLLESIGVRHWQLIAPIFWIESYLANFFGKLDGYI